ncbi:MAG: GGDEF domain-containing protein [SAR86 cluster bacterium]|uniref:diguanylate cyclase n=1 Tax=SAR86 cluster bacterium TaxID=2030880 RepID=A0A2A4MSN8_9GAMM|nr:MAG: GGDEF domain-containing protein [SAR86 cluster bacterium]
MGKSDESINDEAYQALHEEECPAGDDRCPHLPRVKQLEEAIQQLSALVRTDELTGLYNFRYFNQAMGLEMERTHRSGKPCCLIMMDLDFFKKINDIHGHEVGNTVLSYTASLIRKTIRRLDIACRYGGEEFVLILPDTTLNHAVVFANRLRLIIGNSPIIANQQEVKVTASFGVGLYSNNPAFKLSVKEFTEKVDGFLYQAKQEGRNRVCHEAIEEAVAGVSSEERDLLLGGFLDTE